MLSLNPDQELWSASNLVVLSTRATRRPLAAPHVLRPAVNHCKQEVLASTLCATRSPFCLQPAVSMFPPPQRRAPETHPLGAAVLGTLQASRPVTSRRANHPHSPPFWLVRMVHCETSAVARDFSSLSNTPHSRKEIFCVAASTACDNRSSNLTAITWTSPVRLGRRAAFVISTRSQPLRLHLL